MAKVFNVSFISEGKYFAAGDPIADEDIKPFMLRYHFSRTVELKSRPINLRQKYGQVYDAEGRMVRRQIAQMQTANSEQEFAEEEVDEPLDPTAQDALDEARERHQVDVERQKASTRIAAEHADEAEDAIREEHDLAAENDEFEEMDIPRKPKPKVAAGSTKLFVKRRGGKFIPAANAYLVPGEKLFRFRRRQFGVPAKYIVHSTVEE